MTSISLDSSEDLFSECATWLLNTGLWDGVSISWKEADSLRTELEQRLTQLLFSQDPESIGFQQLAANLAWVGANASDRTLLDKKIEELRE